MLHILTIINGFIWNNLITWFLIFAGLFFTIYFRFIQIRLILPALKAFSHSREHSEKSLSSFQAFSTSLAQKVGTGNLAGVATAIYSGGEGSIFWMWVTAILGASTAFVECTLAQVFKLKNADGSFSGGPSYYIQYGLKSKRLAQFFSLLLILALGVIFNAVQSNTIAQGLSSSLNIDPVYSGLLISSLSFLVIFGGMKRIAKVTEILVPVMALSYILLTMYVMLIHFAQLMPLIKSIISSAFSGKAAIGGVMGHSVKEAFRYGVSRGLFANEAGFGTAPNAAATADTSHPVKQGLMQLVAVYVDTLLICSATAFLILLSPYESSFTGVLLTQRAAEYHFGFIGHFFIGLAIILFGFTTIIGNTFFAEGNIKFLSNNKKIILVFRLLVVFVIFIGSLLSVPLVWEMADLVSAVMLTINLLAIIILAKIVKKTLVHFESNNKSPLDFKYLGIKDLTGYNFALKNPGLND